MYSKHSGYAWHKFHTLVPHIRNDTHSIGIVTGPFRKHRIRAKNEVEPEVLEESALACERLAGAFIEYLQQQFPSTRIRLRNDANESVALAYSRMIVARQTIVGGVSTFGAYAALASMGQAYTIAPDFSHAPDKWMLHWEKSDQENSNVKIVHDPYPLLLPQANYLWWQEKRKGGREAMIEWLAQDISSPESPLIQKARLQHPAK